MLIKTIVDPNFESAVRLVRSEFDNEKNEMVSTELWIAEMEYDGTFVENITREISKWRVHTTYVFDYESSTDAGDGRDDYSEEETDVAISLEACILKDGAFDGVVCKAYDRESYIRINCPKICISQQGNYSGRGYHCYRYTFFELLRK